MGGLTTKAEEYREDAEQAGRQAEQASEVEAKRAWQQLARD
jgi:hypothetical protein